MRRLPTLLAAALLLTACGEQFDPPSYVNKLRLLAIRADAPEIETPARGEDGTPLDPQPEGRAPDRTTITSLIADPLQIDDAAREAVVVYLACTPEPGSLEAGICSLVETYADPTQLPELLQQGGGACGGGGGTPPGVFGQGITGGISFAGFERCDQELGCRPVETTVGGTPVTFPAPTYVLPEDFDLEALPAGHPQRTNGVQVLTIAIAVVATPAELLDGADPADACAFADRVSANLGRLLESRERITAIKRVQVRGPDNGDEVNVNPVIEGFSANGTPLPAELAEPVQAEARFAPAKKAKLLPALPLGGDGQPLTDEAVYQPYTRYDAEGEFLREEREAWLWSWFTTGGQFEQDRTRALDEAQEWTAPGDDADYPVPAHRRVFLYSVVRDARGGIAWAKREVRID
ncbi:hypothetical protein [Vulgatibacter sp.]|uniref:hypothetical protein n=1 Tax=Vulgatibacter sp. TaxID=1971226 RepID=UPI0035647A81